MIHNYYTLKRCYYISTPLSRARPELPDHIHQPPQRDSNLQFLPSYSYSYSYSISRKMSRVLLNINILDK